MKLDNDSDSRQLQSKLQAITADIRTLANGYQGNASALLVVLRELEHLHREIREELFQASLPDSRQNLYALLKDMEEAGGWPYIDRMKLRSLLENLPEFGTHAVKGKCSEAEILSTDRLDSTN